MADGCLETVPCLTSSSSSSYADYLSYCYYCYFYEKAISLRFSLIEPLTGYDCFICCVLWDWAELRVAGISCIDFWTLLTVTECCELFLLAGRSGERGVLPPPLVPWCRLPISDSSLSWAISARATGWFLWSSSSSLPGMIDWAGWSVAPSEILSWEKLCPN